MYPIKQMEIGDSFFVPNCRSPNNFYVAARLEKIALSARIVEEDGLVGYRFWRVE